MQNGQEINVDELKREAEEFNKKLQLDKLNQLVKIDQKGTLKNRKRTSTIDIPGTKANKDAKDLGFETVPKATSLKKK